MCRKRGTFGIVGGLLMIIAALLLTGYNIWESTNAGKVSKEDVIVLQKQVIEANSKDEKPLYESYPDLEMPVCEIEGEKYIGVLEIPSQNLSLPIISEWSELRLHKAVCRYSGSAYDGSLIIAGHNYLTHFSKIKNLSQGDEVVLTDADGNVFYYKVLDFEKINGSDIEGMQSGTWDLTLFTCDYSGRNRITVRCVREK